MSATVSPQEFGQIVRRKRQHIANQLDESLSKSKRRKLAKDAGKLTKQPFKSFDKSCGVLYNEVLQNLKSKEITSHLDSILKLLWDQESPLVTTKEDGDLIAVYCRPCVSRCLQVLLKYGSEDQKLTVCDKLLPMVTTLCINGSGYHLCSKLWSALSKESRKLFVEALMTKPKIYFTKFGSRLWDAVAKTGNARLRDRMLITLFIASPAEKINFDVVTTLESYIASIPGEQSQIRRDFVLSRVDKLVKKEILSSNLCHHLLAAICKPQSQSSLFEDRDFMKQLTDSIFEGSAELLATKEGVSCLCRLVGYWDAKRRKQFLTQMKGVLSLRKQTWHDYFMNEVDGLFVCRFLCTIDDTKQAIKSVLCPIFGCTMEKGNDLKVSTNELAKRVFASPKACAWLIQLLKAERAKSFLTHEERQRLEYPSETSKKDKDIRSEEYRAHFFVPLWKAVELVKDDIEPASPQHTQMLEILRESMRSI